MANRQDIELAAAKGRRAVEQADLAAAREALGELDELARTFEAVAKKVSSPSQRQRVKELQADLSKAREALQAGIDELEIDQLDPHYEERVREREQQRPGHEWASRAKAAALFKTLGGPLVALAELVDPAARSAARASGIEVRCGKCQTENPNHAKHCMNCGHPLASG